MTRNAVWTLSNLCRGKNPPTNFESVAPGEIVVPILFSQVDKEQIIMINFVL